MKSVKQALSIAAAIAFAAIALPAARAMAAVSSPTVKTG